MAQRDLPPLDGTRPTPTWQVGETLRLLGVVATNLHEEKLAVDLLQQSADAFRRVGDDEGLALVDPASGGVAHAGCPTRVAEVFIAGTEPNTFCPLHSHAAVGRRTTLTPHQALPHEITSPTPARPEAMSP